MVGSPPGDKRVICVKWISFIVNKDSIKEIPVSLAPTTIILLLLDTLLEDNIFLVIIERENTLSS